MEPLQRPTAEHRVEIEASPEAVWSIVSDVTRIPEWSPVCHRVELLSADVSRFRGHNRLNGARWSRECVVTESVPGEVFGFSTVFKGAESTRWRYRLEPTGAGTAVTEAYEIVSMPSWVRLLRRLPGAEAKSERDTRRNLETSLARLKAIAEA